MRLSFFFYLGCGCLLEKKNNNGMYRVDNNANDYTVGFDKNC